MKLVRGRTLADALEDADGLAGRLELLSHFVDLCQALAYAHSRGVVHRDVKPANVMLGEFGETVLLDWGLAKVRGKRDIHDKAIERGVNLWADAEQTVVGSALGTPAFMSPEQAEGRVEEIDERSDVWSLGVVLYQLLTGRLPFDARHALAMIEAVKAAQVRPVAEVCPEVPPDLAAVAEKALCKDPAQRYQTAGELAAEIRSFMSGARVGAYAYGSVELLKRLIARNKAVTAALAALLLTLLAGFVVVSGAWRSAERSRAEAVRARAEVERTERRTHLHLSEAFRQRSDQLLQRRNWLGARLATAASLVHNPHNPASEHRFAEGERVEQGRDLLAASQSVLFLAKRHGALSHLRTWRTHTDEVLSAGWSPDGKWLASGGWDGRAAMHAEGQEAVVLQGHEGPVSAVAFDPAGDRLMTASHDRTLRVWSVPSGRPLATLQGHADQVWAVAFSPDGGLVASSDEAGGVALWDAKTLETKRWLQRRGAAVRHLAWTRDGALLATASMDTRVRLWSPDGGKPVATLIGHTAGVEAVDVSSSGLLASAGIDKTVRLWRLPAGAAVGELRGHEGQVEGVEFSPDGRWLASASIDGTARLWSVAGRRLAETLRGHDRAVTGLAFAPDSGRLATTGADRLLREWRLAAPVEATPLRTRTGYRAWQTKWSRDGALLATGAQDGSVWVFDVATGEALMSSKVHDAGLYGVTFVGDGDLLASVSSDRTVRLWSARTGEARGVLRGHGDGLLAATASRDGETVVSVDRGGRVRVWSVSALRLVTEFPGRGSVALSPDGGLLATGGEESSVVLRSTEGWTEVRRLTGHA